MTVQKYLETGVASRLKNAEVYLDTAESEIVNRFHGFGTLAVAGAGLLDGINPCAFATIVFFISYMNLVGRGRKEMLIAGGAFALAVFVTYLLVGVGTLSFMSYLNQFSGVAKCVYLLAATATFALAGLSLYDAVKAKAGQNERHLFAAASRLETADSQGYPRTHAYVWRYCRCLGDRIYYLGIGTGLYRTSLPADANLRRRH